MYLNFDIWKSSIEKGRSIIKKRMTVSSQEKVIGTVLADYDYRLKEHRQSNYFQSIAWSEFTRALEIRNRHLPKKTKSSIK